MDKQLLGELHASFEAMKKDLKFKASFDELEDIFFVKDFVAKEGFVSERLSRSLCHRITNLLMSWNGYLHNIIVPNPGDMVMVEENQMLAEEQKNEIITSMNRIMELVSRNQWIGLTKDRAEEGKFIDDSVSFWNSDLKPKLLKLSAHVNKGWKQRALSPQDSAEH